MTDTVTILQDRLAKGEAKVARFKKQLEAAEIEVSDIQTALRVIGQVFNQPGGDSGNADQSTTMTRQTDILNILKAGRENSVTPADLYETFKLISLEVINIDTFRTTLWRMKNKVYTLADGKWIVEGDNGEYWKREVEGLSTKPARSPPMDFNPATTGVTDPPTGNPFRVDRPQGNPFAGMPDFPPIEEEDDDLPPF